MSSGILLAPATSIAQVLSLPDGRPVDPEVAQVDCSVRAVACVIPNTDINTVSGRQGAVREAIDIRHIGPQHRKAALGSIGREHRCLTPRQGRKKSYSEVVPRLAVVNREWAVWQPRCQCRGSFRDLTLRQRAAASPESRSIRLEGVDQRPLPVLAA